ncbi:unnamed protein product [Euphydryas editha]|uniref:Neuropeptide F n=1 Tax=Euphydryas editha TaxID=104508 RepID=A0AAU9TII0_EUPED|nr:unnamed protein product [Euphydryas editha]
MFNKKIVVIIAVVLAMFYFAEAREEGPHDMADALRMLQELDRLYTQASRPRLLDDFLHAKMINDDSFETPMSSAYGVYRDLVLTF